MPPQLIMLLVQFGLQYGPEAIARIAALLRNSGATVDDVEAAFADLKPYSAYGIPVNVPVKTGTIVPTAPVGTLPTVPVGTLPGGIAGQ